MPKSFIYSWELDLNLNKINDGEIEIVSYANKSNHYFPYLLKSADKFNYPLKILGWNTEWVYFGNKLVGYYEYFKSLDSCYNNRYALIIDSWDVLLLKSYSQLIEESRKFNYDIIFYSNYMIERNTDKTNIERYFLNYMLMILFNSDQSKYHINSGVMLIKIHTYIELFEKYLPTLYTDDQVFFVNAYKKNTQYKIIVDHYGYFFLSQDKMLGDAYKCISRIKTNEIDPFTIHGCGGSSLESILQLKFNDIITSKIELIRPADITISSNYIINLFKNIIRSKGITIILLIIGAFINL